MDKRKRALLGVLLTLAALVAPGFYNGLTVQRYSVEAEKVHQPIRIVLITDLHSCRYGDQAKELIDRVDAQKPDLVMLAGDIFDDVISDENTEHLLAGISGKYPCYYVTGNHEYWSGSGAFAEKMAILDRWDVRRLSGELETITVRGERVNVCGVDDPDGSRMAAQDTLSFTGQLARVKELSQNGNYTILLSHRPESFPLYVSYGFDLVLCGHAHGGQWRIPGLLNGLYAPDQGFFPPYAGGEYQRDETTMIVSRGLARESTRLPRFYNPPELVVIDLR